MVVAAVEWAARDGAFEKGMLNTGMLLFDIKDVT